jgi:hypothetical protein
MEQRWRVPDLMLLADETFRGGLNSFIVRRTLQRLERNEIDVTDAVRVLRLARIARSPETVVDTLVR